jgi:large subunit ribosomal protein L7Ae
MAPRGKKATKAASVKDWKSAHPHLFSKSPRNFGIGRDLRPKTDLSRYVRWPRYVRIQRQRAILKSRIKVPPSLNQFTRTLDKNQATNLFQLLSKYRPESKEDKKMRLQKAAEAQAANQEVPAGDKPKVVKFGINHVTTLVETGKAKLVVVAADVDPVEICIHLPALCRRKNIPYVIVKGKARLGRVVNLKTCTSLAITEVNKEDQAKLDQIAQSARLFYNEDVAHLKKWGGGIRGVKAQAIVDRAERIRREELAAKGESL